MKNEIWKPYTLTTDSFFFPIFQQVIKQSDGKDSLIVSVVNRERSEKLKKEIRDHYRLVFQHQENEICEIDVFKKIEDS